MHRDSNGSFGAEQLASLGHTGAPFLGAGMEAVAYRTSDGGVLKIWRDRSVEEVRRIQNFYQELSVQLPYLTPSISEVDQIEGITVSWEVELSGVTLKQRLADGLSIDTGIEIELDLLAALREVIPGSALGELPVLDETVGLYAAETDWRFALVELIRRQASRYRCVFERALPQLDHLVRSLATDITALEEVASRPIHGDLIGANILLGLDDTPLAILDFGFLSTVGDPDFDLAVSAAIFDMYSPASAAIRRRFLELAARRFEVDHRKIVIYLAAYSFSTACAYDAKGNDGHFAWCIDRIFEYAASVG